MKIKYVGVGENRFLKQGETYYSPDWDDATQFCKVYSHKGSTEWGWYSKGLFEEAQDIAYDDKENLFTAAQACSVALRKVSPTLQRVLEGISAASEIGKFSLDTLIRLTETEVFNLEARGFDVEKNSIEGVTTINWKTRNLYSFF